MEPSEGQSSLWRRWASLIWLTAVLVPVTLLQPYRNRPTIRADGEGYHLWTYALLKGDLVFSWYHGDAPRVSLIGTDPSRNSYSCKYPPGLALLRLPFMIAVVDPERGGPPFSDAEHR